MSFLPARDRFIPGLLITRHGNKQDRQLCSCCRSTKEGLCGHRRRGGSTACTDGLVSAPYLQKQCLCQCAPLEHQVSVCAELIAASAGDGFYLFCFVPVHICDAAVGSWCHQAPSESSISAECAQAVPGVGVGCQVYVEQHTPAGGCHPGSFSLAFASSQETQVTSYGWFCCALAVVLLSAG